MRQRTNRANSATSAQRPDYYKKMNQDFYFQSQAIFCADFIVDHIITRGANFMYSRYVNQKFPKHIAETYTEYLYKLSSTYVMAYDVHNESTPSHKITEDIEPPRVRTDSYMTDRIKLHKKINPNVSGDISEFIDAEKHVLFNTNSEQGSPSKRTSLLGYNPNTRSQQNSSKGERMSIKSSLRNSKEMKMDAVVLTEQSRMSDGGRAKTPVIPTATKDIGVWVNKEEGSPSKVNTSASFRDSFEMAGGGKGKRIDQQKNLAKKNLQQDYDVVIVPIVKDSDMDASSSNRQDIEGEMRKAYFDSLAKKKKDDEEEQEKQKKLLKAKRAVESIGRAGPGGQPAYTYGYNAEIIRTKGTLSPLKKDLMIKPKFEVSVISKVIPRPSPAQSVHPNTLSTHASMPNNHSGGTKERRGSADQTNKFVEMLKGYGIKVNLDPKTYAPIITDDMIKELERKTKGKILDQIDLKPGVKFIEPSPEKEKERVKERGLFMTQYDAQTGFPRITKKMYNQAKGASEIIEKHKIEEELAKVNASHITPEPKPEVSDSRKESMDETGFNTSGQPIGRPALQPLKNRPKLPPKSEKKAAEGDHEMTFAGKELNGSGKPPAKPARTASANPREAAKLPRPSHNTMRNPDQGGGKLDISLPLNSNLVERQRKEQLITKKNWRVRSSHRPDKSLLTGYERGTVSITTGRDTSFDISYAKNLNGTKQGQGEKKEKTGDISRPNHGDDSVHIENTKYLDLLEL